jgi:CO/xanthine dehydrogenase Mo-binding subunit
MGDGTWLSLEEAVAAFAFYAHDAPLLVGHVDSGVLAPQRKWSVNGAAHARHAPYATRPAGGAGHGFGLAYARYKNTEAHAAIVAEVEVDERVVVKTVWCCVDAGRVAHPDGLRNQVEGGIVQSMSWALFEEVRLTADGTLPRSWVDYPILRFPDVPRIHVDIVESNERMPLGAGEVATGPATAAVANAVAHALGTPLRELPLTRERVIATI